MKLWSVHLESQALQHVRYRIKRMSEYRIDGRFKNIRELERHISSLPQILNPTALYNKMIDEFRLMAEQNDYAAVLRVFNHKPMLVASGIDRLLGFSNIDSYISAVLAL